MSQTEQHCACNHPELVMLPVRGFGLAVDPSGLVPAPGPAPVCREGSIRTCTSTSTATCKPRATA